MKDAPIVINGNTAIAWGTSDDIYKMADGSDFTIPTQWTATLVKNSDGWKIIECHISTDIFNNPVLDMSVRQSSYTWGGLGAVIGLLVGVIISGVYFRRRT